MPENTVPYIENFRILQLGRVLKPHLQTITKLVFSFAPELKSLLKDQYEMEGDNLTKHLAERLKIILDVNYAFRQGAIQGTITETALDQS